MSCLYAFSVNTADLCVIGPCIFFLFFFCTSALFDSCFFLVVVIFKTFSLSVWFQFKFRCLFLFFAAVLVSSVFPHLFLFLVFLLASVPLFVILVSRCIYPLSSELFPLLL